MKCLSIVISSVLLLAVSAKAEYHKGNHSLEFHFGPAGYSDDMNVNNGETILRDGGATGGFQYLYFIHSGPTLAIGPDILWSDLSEENDSTMAPGGKSHASENMAIYQMVMKLAYPSGHFRPYLLGGIGASRASLQGDITPGPGQTFDSVRYGFAGTMALGFDFFPREHWFLGLEGRVVALSRLLHEPTEAGQARGIQPVRDPGSLSTILLRLGYKFGA